MTNNIDVAIIGAGPYGLSLAAYLSRANIEYRIFGKTMEHWKLNMPPGMLLKSHPWGTNIYDPNATFTLKQFYDDSKIDYNDYLIAVPLETFIAYGEAFKNKFVINVENKKIISIEHSKDGFIAEFDDGELLYARKIIIGVGVHPFKYIPPRLSYLPHELCSHSSEYGSLSYLKGKNVAILGSGASATDIAVLLNSQGSQVSLIARSDELPFMPAPVAKNLLFPKLRQRASFLKPIKRMISSNSCIGDSWLLKVCAEMPDIFHMLPKQTRLDIVNSELGPSGHWAIKNAIQNHIQLHLGSNIDSAEPSGNKIKLELISNKGSKEIIYADHLIAATGFRIDLNQLSFLSKIQKDIRVIENTPVLSKNYESSVPGLYFIGPVTANSFGPIARFVCGAIFPAKRIAQHLSKEIKTPICLNKSARHPKILMLATLFRTPYRALRCAQAAGAEVYVLGTTGAKGLKTSRYCKEFIPSRAYINGRFDSNLAHEINQIIEDQQIDKVFAADTPSTRSLIAIRELIKAPCFPMPDLETFDLLNNKWEFYRLCNTLGIRCPKTKLYQNKHEIHLNETRQIAKPIDKEASAGVIKLDSEKQIEKIVYEPILVQDFIEGEDIGVSVFCQKGHIQAIVMHTYKQYTYVSFFDQSIYDDINKIVQHLKLDGLFNFDMRRTEEGGIFYLECNPRVFWKISMAMLAGINFVSLGIAEEPKKTLIKASASFIRFPKSTLFYAATAPWKLEKSSWEVLKFLYNDPIPYLREICGFENDLTGSYR